jgi:hypothetical protein
MVGRLVLPTVDCNFLNKLKELCSPAQCSHVRERVNHAADATDSLAVFLWGVVSDTRKAGRVEKCGYELVTELKTCQEEKRRESLKT